VARRYINTVAAAADALIPAEVSPTSRPNSATSIPPGTGAMLQINEVPALTGINAVNGRW